jgi:hypothetical protein
LFILRDFDDRGNNFERIKGILEKDLATIWSEIYKPEKFANSTPQQFFEFEYSMLPHKIYQEDAFISKTSELKTRFEVGVTNSLFLS